MGPRSRVEAFLPLTPPMLHTLVALADGDKHGYAILKEIARRTDGAVRLSAGTLYALIRRAEADGLIVETDKRPDISLDDERRRYYRLTPLGRKVAAAEIERLEAIVEMARDKKLVARDKKLVPRPKSI
jgi:DNA-binding PadR family transcriptional regulator